MITVLTEPVKDTAEAEQAAKREKYSKASR